MVRFPTLAQSLPARMKQASTNKLGSGHISLVQSATLDCNQACIKYGKNLLQGY